MRDMKRAAQIGFDRESAERRAHNRRNSAVILEAFGVKFSTNNDGQHLVIPLADRIIDFWPGTGTYIDRKTRSKGRGVKPLIKLLASLGVELKPDETEDRKTLDDCKKRFEGTEPMPFGGFPRPNDLVD